MRYARVLPDTYHHFVIVETQTSVSLHHALDCILCTWLQKRRSDHLMPQRRPQNNNLMAKDLFTWRGTNVRTALTGKDGDISNLCQYKPYNWCYFREQKHSFPLNRVMLRRVLRPAMGEGNEMAQWILKANGNAVPRWSSRPLKVDEIHLPTEIKKREIFNGLIERRWGTSINPPKWSSEKSDDNEFEEFEDERKRIIPDIEEMVGKWQAT